MAWHECRPQQRHRRHSAPLHGQTEASTNFFPDHHLVDARRRREPCFISLVPVFPRSRDHRDGRQGIKVKPPPTTPRLGLSSCAGRWASSVRTAQASVEKACFWHPSGSQLGARVGWPWRRPRTHFPARCDRARSVCPKRPVSGRVSVTCQHGGTSWPTRGREP